MEEHLAKQRAIVERRQASNLPNAEAEALLVTFEDVHRQHEAHLAEAEQVKAEQDS